MLAADVATGLNLGYLHSWVILVQVKLHLGEEEEKEEEEENEEKGNKEREMKKRNIRRKGLKEEEEE